MCKRGGIHFLYLLLHHRHHSHPMCSVNIHIVWFFFCFFFRSIQKRRYTLQYVYAAMARHLAAYGQCYMSIDRKYGTQCRTSIFIGNDVSTHVVASNFYIYLSNVRPRSKESFIVEIFRQCVSCVLFFFFIHSFLAS